MQVYKLMISTHYALKTDLAHNLMDPGASPSLPYQVDFGHELGGSPTWVRPHYILYAILFSVLTRS